MLLVNGLINIIYGFINKIDVNILSNIKKYFVLLKMYKSSKIQNLFLLNVFSYNF
jgi:hypothetical protein